MQLSQPDVLIIGAGVIGLQAAYHLRQQGRSVLVVDQNEPGSGSSHGNCGLISPSHVLPNTLPGLPWKAFKWMFQSNAPFKVSPQLDGDFLRWMWGFWRNCDMAQVRATAPAIARILASSRQLLAEQVAAEQMAIEYQENGCLYVYGTPAGLAAELAWHPIYAECGVKVDVLDRAALTAFEPALKPDAIHGGTFFPDDASLRPDRYVRELLALVRRKGVEVRSNVKVHDLSERHQAMLVHTETGELAAGQVLLTAGSWSPLLSKRLGFRLPIQPGKGYSLTFQRPERCPSHPMVLKEKSVAVTPWPSGLRLGSTMEFAGYDASLPAQRLQLLTTGADSLLHGAFASIPRTERQEWYGWRPMTTDTLPIIDRAPGFRNLWLATGHSMLGVSMSPASGKLITELMTAAKPHIDPTPYCYARFA
jgi:D-amino-acid dehydrogenase